MARVLTIVFMLLIACRWTAAAQDRIEDDPGFVDFSRLSDEFGGQPTIEVNIHGALLRLVAEASEMDDPELASLLRRVRGVYVRGFELRRLDLERVRRYKDAMAEVLENSRWDTVVRVRDDDEDVNFYVRLDGDVIAGIVVMSINLDEDQTVFLNIVGDINPEEIGRIGRKFGVSGVNRY